MCQEDCQVHQEEHGGLLAFDPCRGQVATLKLSPNLRQRTKGEDKAAAVAAEQSRLEAVLTVARKRVEAFDKALNDLSQPT